MQGRVQIVDIVNVRYIFKIKKEVYSTRNYEQGRVSRNNRFDETLGRKVCHSLGQSLPYVVLIIYKSGRQKTAKVMDRSLNRISYRMKL